MTLLLPLALLGLLTLPLILLLHLLRNRREQLPIPSLRLWFNLHQRRRGQLPRNIPLSLMLFLQLLVAAALAFSLARPVSSFLRAVPQQTIFVLDLTTSMTAQTLTGQSRFDQARQTIQAHLPDMESQDQVAVVGLGPEPQLLLAGSGEQQAALLATLANLVPGATGFDLPGALTLANGLVDPEQESRIIVLTDGAYDLSDQPLPPARAPLTWRFIPDPGDSSPPNQALLDTASRLLPDGRHRLFTRLVNYGDTPAQRTLRLTVDGTVAAEEPVTLEPQADLIRLWTISAPAETAAVELVEGDALPLDNRAELLLLGPVRQRVLLVSAGSEALIRALEVQPGVQLAVSQQGLEPYDPADFDLVVFEELPLALTSWPAGNVWVINPPLGHLLLPAEGSASNLRPDLAEASALLAGVDLSGVYFNGVPRLTVPDWAEVDLESTAGQPLIFHGSVAGSRIMVWAFGLDASNLAARLALPLLTANTLSTLLAPSPPAAIPVGQPVELPRTFSVAVPEGFRLFMEVGQAESGPNRFTRTKQPGIYRIYNSSDTLVAGFAVHAGSPQESNLLRATSSPELPPLEAAALTGPTPDIGYEEFWPWLAGLALLVITLEGWLAWRR